MQMQHVRYFLALCEDCNFTRAARRCGVRQPTLSQAIKQLEAEFGGALFERRGRTTTLTALGTALRPHIVAIAAANERAQREATTRIAVGATPLPHTFVLSHQPKENAMRKIVIGIGVAAIVLLVAEMAVRAPNDSRASTAQPARVASDVYAIEAGINVQSLPRQDILSEADE